MPSAQSYGVAPTEPRVHQPAKNTSTSTAAAATPAAIAPTIFTVFLFFIQFTPLPRAYTR